MTIIEEIHKLVKQHNKYTKYTKTYARKYRGNKISLRVEHKEYGTVYSYLTSASVMLGCMRLALEQDKEIASWKDVDKVQEVLISLYDTPAKYTLWEKFPEYADYKLEPLN